MYRRVLRYLRKNLSRAQIAKLIVVYSSKTIAAINPAYCSGNIVWYALSGTGNVQLTLFWQLVFLNAYANTLLCVFKN